MKIWQKKVARRTRRNEQARNRHAILSVEEKEIQHTKQREAYERRKEKKLLSMSHSRQVQEASDCFLQRPFVTRQPNEELHQCIFISSLLV